jgi:hypothetical protein
MKYHVLIRLSLAAAGMAALSGCAPSIAWVKPGASPAQMALEQAQCHTFAEATTPDPGAANIHTHHHAPDAMANLLLDVASAGVYQDGVNRTYNNCMARAGYMDGALLAAAAPPINATPLPGPPPVGPPVAPALPPSAAVPAPVAAAPIALGHRHR